jgi:hypothetical protein
MQSLPFNGSQYQKSACEPMQVCWHNEIHPLALHANLVRFCILTCKGCDRSCIKNKMTIALFTCGGTLNVNCANLTTRQYLRVMREFLI